ncbi:MAG: hypothetical protein ABL961_01860 [Vicinamibacterales bacterium]
MIYILYFSIGAAAFGAVIGGLVARSLRRACWDGLIAAGVFPSTLVGLVALPGTFAYSAECAVVVTALTIFFVEGRLRKARAAKP